MKRLAQAPGQPLNHGSRANWSRVQVAHQPRQVVCETLSRKNPLHTKKANKTKQNKKNAGGMVQGVGLEFKLQYCQTNKHTKINK
jgi:hypothetical protein